MKTQCKGILLGVLIAMVVVSPSMALPTIGAAGGVTSSNATFAINGASGSTSVWYGLNSGHPAWKSDNATPVGGVTSITIWGSPILGGTKYYATACDNTGCGNEVSFTTLAITPIPTRGFDAGFNGMASSHFSLIGMGAWLIWPYTTSIPTALFFGFIFGIIVIGFWRTTKSVRLVGGLFMILSPLLLTKEAGLYLGMPTMMQQLGAVLFAAGMAGVLLSLVKK